MRTRKLYNTYWMPRRYLAEEPSPNIVIHARLASTMIEPFYQEMELGVNHRSRSLVLAASLKID